MSHPHRGRRRSFCSWLGTCESLEQRKLLAVVTVNNISDAINGSTTSIAQLIATPGMDGISLREAITAANNTPNDGGPDEIRFNIPGPGPHTIIPVSVLPSITGGSLIIDGTTEPDFAGSPIVELNGNNNVFNGLTISTASAGSVIRGLVINRFGGNGLVISLSNVIEGNYIGTNVEGTIDLGNAGIGITFSGTGNRIGGTTPGARNVISGNNVSGIGMSGNLSGTIIQGNYIGTNAAGTAALGNSQDGIVVSGASAPLIGGTVAGAGNLISGNGINGIHVSGMGAGAIIQGNQIGTNAAGTAPLPNVAAGIRLASSNNLVGGTLAGAGNLISGNGTHGILLTGAAITGNVVQGNRIGTDLTGTYAIQNAQHGVMIDGTTGTLIGGTTAEAQNLISGNSQAGVWVDNSASEVTISGNFIGTDLAGTAPLGNLVGVVVSSATSAIVGGIALGAGNLISANANVGVLILTTGGFNSVTQILGNRIGTDASGTLPLGNAEEGIYNGGAAVALIGGTTAEARNLISGNGSAGIRYIASTSVLGNYIGTDITGTFAVPNAGNGITATSLASGTIGATTPGSGNLISGNLGHGILITGGSKTVYRNLIGTQADGVSALGNGLHGILLNGVALSSIGNSSVANGNRIAFNGGNGVTVTGSTTGNQIVNNSIHTNVGLGIDLANDGVSPNDTGDADTGPNARQNFPVITSAVPAAGGRTIITGTLNSTPNTDFTLHFYRSPLVDSSGYGEGESPFATFPISTDPNGHRAFSFDFPVALGTGEWVSATATQADGSTSEFSQGIQVIELPSLTIDSVSVTEGDSGTTSVVFTVHRTGDTTAASSVLYTTAPDTAAAPDDYLHVPTTLLNFAPGETSQSITVLVRGDMTSEPDETFFVNLSGAVGATIDDPQAVGTIVNDDGDAISPVVLNAAFDVIGSLPTPYEARFTLSEPVTGPVGGVPLLIRRIDNGQLVTTLFADIENGTLLRGEFLQPLPEGNYRATLPAGAVADTAGNLLLSDVDLSFFVLVADANQDRHVDTADFTALAANFNKTSGVTFGGGDFNYDGRVNALDFNALASRFGTYLAPPAGFAAASAGSTPLPIGPTRFNLFGESSILDQERENGVL